MSFQDIYDSIMTVDDYLWKVVFVLLVTFGIFATIRFKGLQVTRVSHAVNLTLNDIKSKDSKNKVSSFEAFCISMGARIGVGNIVGTSAAIMAGGPGAILWMWIFATIGSASSFVETIIGQIYKEKKSDGETYGGPAYYASKGFKSRKVGIIVAFVMLMMFAVGFMGLECCTTVNALTNAFEFKNNNIFFSALITLLFVPIALGGAKRIGIISAKIVPVMSFAWLAFAVAIIACNFQNIPNAFYMIFNYAFNVPSVIGGGIGTAIMIGLQRGIFSNEAGIGTVTGISSIANVKHPVKQGYVQAFGVFIDTIIICSLTAMVILTSSAYEVGISDVSAIGLVQMVTSNVVGPSANAIIALFMFVFAFTCMVSDYLSSETNMRFIKDNKYCIGALRIFLICFVFFACMTKTENMFDLLDILMAITAIVNVVLLIKLYKRAVEASKDYDKQREEGVEEPVFHKNVLSDTSEVTEWD